MQSNHIYVSVVKLDFHMFEQDSALAHQSCKIVVFWITRCLISCCLVLTRWTFLISEPD